MSTFYTYYSWEEWGRGYIGYRKCPVGKTPETDQYMGSYEDKTFKPTAKEILGIYGSREEAMQAEIILHEFFDVAKNPHFANKACQTSTKFSFCLTGENHPMYGKSRSDETKRKISEARKGKFTGENHPMYGKTLSPEHRRKMSEAKKGENNPLYGKSPSEKTRKKISEAKKGEKNPMYGKSPSEKTRKKISEARKGEKNPMYGKSPSEKTRKKISEALKGKVSSDETRRKISEAKSKLRDWYHPYHGEIFQTSATDLVRMFPEQKLHRGSLNDVALGRCRQHKGWRAILRGEKTPTHA